MIVTALLFDRFAGGLAALFSLRGKPLFDAAIVVIGGIFLWMAARRLRVRPVLTRSGAGSVKVSVPPIRIPRVVSIQWSLVSGREVRATLQGEPGTPELFRGSPYEGLMTRADRERTIAFEQRDPGEGSTSVNVSAASWLRGMRWIRPFRAKWDFRLDIQWPATPQKTVAVDSQSGGGWRSVMPSGSETRWDALPSGVPQEPKSEATPQEKAPSKLGPLESLPWGEPPEPWKLERTSPKSEAPIEETIVTIANAMIAQRGDRRQVRILLNPYGAEIRFYTPYNTPESARLVFTKYWFEEDDRAGDWLGAVGGGSRELIAVPFDFRTYRREQLLSYLSSLFDGVGASREALADGNVRIRAAARLLRNDDGSFNIVKRGAIEAIGVREASSPATSSGEGSAVAELRRMVGHLESSMSALQAVVARLEAGFKKVPSAAAQPTHTSIDGVMMRVDGLERAVRRIEERLETLILPVSHVAVGVAPASVASLPASTDLPSRVPDVAVDARLSARLSEAAMITSEPAAGGEPLRLPEGWRDSVQRSAEGDANFTDGYKYAAGVQRLYMDLLRFSSATLSVVVVHLLSSVDRTSRLFVAHFGDTFADGSGSFVLRCVDNPGARTPAQQFFAAFADPTSTRLLILCPPGQYGPLFDFASLIENRPSGAFVISEVREPAHLERVQGDVFRVDSPMEIVTAH